MPQRPSAPGAFAAPCAPDTAVAPLSPFSAPAPDLADTPDLLTQILLSLRLDGVEYGRCVMHAPWAVAFPAVSSARFHFVGSGGAWLRTPSSEWQHLAPGDAVLLPHGSLHVLASAPEVAPVDIDSLARRPVSDNIYLVDGRGCQGHSPAVQTVNAAATPASAGDGPDVVFSGTLRFNLDPLHPLMAMMPAVMVAGDLARRDGTVPVLLEAMEREVAQDRMGACAILARLADALAASIIRAWVECSCNNPSGWIAAVRCPRIGKVIAAIHANPERDWNVLELADLMGASRSRFAESFTRTMGESPARYVAKVKMSQARSWIARDGMRIAVAAHRLGYESEASFSRAYKRVVGHPPSAARSARVQ